MYIHTPHKIKYFIKYFDDCNRTVTYKFIETFMDS